MAKYNGSGWHKESVRHSRAKRYGRAGGKYAKQQIMPTENWNPIPSNKRYMKISKLPKGMTYSGSNEHGGIWYDKKGRTYIINYDKKYAEKLNTKKKNFGSYTPNNIKGGLADNINPKYFNQLELGKGIKVELEHTNDPKIAREIATDHLSENPKYYEELEKIEGKTKPITVKVSHKEIRRDKNQLEKDLQKSIEETQYPDEKKRLEHLYRELREADNHTKLKRFYNEYGSTLKTLGMAIPFYFLAPVITAGIIIGATVTGDVPSNMVAIRMAVPLTASLIGTLGVKYSVRTLQAIKQREKEIIKEKSQELRDNTILPEKEIKIIAKRVAQQELKNTKLVTELSV